ncbi:MAG: DUF58 domain-containing protein [Candidatus Brocadiia bacterium]
MPEALSQAGIEILARKYRFNPHVIAASGLVGEKEGRETGASVEIQDFRDYVPGDDPRRIDWLAYGRTDRLVVRLFREEVSPFVDVLIDNSASMSIFDGRKASLSHELKEYLYHSSRAGGIAVRLFAAGERLRRLESPEELHFDESHSAIFFSPRRSAAGLRRSAVRILLTDFMDPADPGVVVRALSAGCARLIVLHLLGPWEADPAAEGPATLESVEEGRRADIQLKAGVVEKYKRRLAGLIGAAREETFKCGGLYLNIIADKKLESVLREQFLPKGLVEVY